MPQTTRYRLSELCLILADKGFPATIEGDDRIITRVNTLEEASEGDISFLANPKYLEAAQRTSASAVILKGGIPLREGVSALRCDDPYGAVTAVIVTLHGHRKHPHWGIDKGACIAPTARIGLNPNIAGGVTIAAEAVIGDNCTIYPGCYIAAGVRMGRDCTLFPNVVIYDQCELGDRVTVHSGSVIGEDGMGYAPYGGEWVKIPQVGRALVGDDVEIGANCSIDRATLGTTEIGPGSKFGNVVVIGHGTKVGPNCLFAGLDGIAGSAHVGRHVTLGGLVGVQGHVAIGDNVQVAGHSAIRGNVGDNARILGSPATELSKAKRSMVAVRQLPEWIRRIRELEREVEALRERVKNNGRR
ncbi:MAG: UDP-3-O-(3-hydroxymyristoyl)glucosamine N-acyltransferase [Phycisphaerae bacterium]